jgi:hypothetical protein
VVVNVYPSMMKTGANKELWPSDKDPVAHVQGAGFPCCVRACLQKHPAKKVLAFASSIRV